MNAEKHIIGLSEKYHVKVYNRFPFVVKEGRGTVIRDLSGKKYLDFTSGIGVLNLGHSHPKVINAGIEQMKKFAHVSNLFYTEPQAFLVQELAKNLPGYRVFLTNSGAESIEGAIKFARRWSIVHKGKRATTLVAFEGSFHGRTTGALSLTWNRKYRKDFGALLTGVKFLPYNDPESLLQKVEEDVCAVFVEFIQIEGGGIRLATDSFVNALKRVQKEKRVLIVADEIQTGMGRTGELFSFQHHNILPDIIVMAKALGGGLPLGAILVKDTISELLGPGDHASTFGGNPVACACGLEALKIISKKSFLKSVRERGNFLRAELERVKGELPGIIQDIRGRGLVWGVDTSLDAGKIIESCLKNGLLLTRAGEGTVRFLPPLNVKKNEIKKGLKIFKQSLTEMKS